MNLQLLKVKQVANIFNVSVATIWRWKKDETLNFPQPKNYMGSTRWLKEEIEDHILNSDHSNNNLNQEN